MVSIDEVEIFGFLTFSNWPNFEQFEAPNDLFLTVFVQNQANLRMLRNQKFQLQLY